jgi:hypothetical protein
MSKSDQKSSSPESLGIHIMSGLGKVRDFDQLFAALRSMIEIAEEPPAADTNLRAVWLSHWRNDEMHSWFKTCHALASSLAVRMIHSPTALALTIVLLVVPARPQSAPCSQVSANDLAQRVVTNELNFQDDHSNWMYRLEKEQYGKKQVEEIIETKNGSLSRLLSINDRPLTAKQQLDEDQRVRELMTSRSAQQKLRRALDAETLQGRRLFKMLPAAFVFNYAGSEGNLVKLSFRPNQSFHPPSMEARVFHDMEGEMWVDCKQERLAGFDGHLTQSVNFGFGLLGHLDKGGHFEVRQAEVAPGHWGMITLSLEMTGKALLFAIIGVQKRETHRDFQRVSDDLTLTEAAGILNNQMVVADNR